MILSGVDKISRWGRSVPSKGVVEPTPRREEIEMSQSVRRRLVYKVPPLNGQGDALQWRPINRGTSSITQGELWDDGDDGNEGVTLLN